MALEESQVIKRRRLISYLQLLPASVYYLALFGAPVILLVVYSFFQARNYQYIPAFTLENYYEVATGPRYSKVFLRTLRVAFTGTIITVFIAYVYSFIVTFILRARRQMLYFLILVSLFGGYLVRIFAWRNIFGTRGFLNQSLMTLGITSEPLDFLSNSEFTVVVALINFYIPFAILPIFAGMQNISPGLIEAAQDLGLPRYRAAATLVLPMAFRGVSAAFMLVFVSMAGEWVTPSMLGGTHNQMIGNEIQYQFGPGFNWPVGAAIAVLLVLSLGVILAVLAMTVRKWLR